MSESEPIADRRFEFGRNWQRFLEVIDEARIVEAERALARMLGMTTLTGRTFLDVGCGSGLSSLAARRLGATVLAFDYDPASVACATELKRRVCPADPLWRVVSGSALDRDFLASLGQFDIVYSWGVLHHTGNMWQALANVVGLVARGGTLFISIYNDQRWQSAAWRFVKRGYNRLPAFLRPALEIPAFIVLWAPNIIKNALTGDPYRGLRNCYQVRGMSAWHDLRDWVGGYPFEVAKPEAIFRFFRDRGFVLRELVTCGGGLGCNEYVFGRVGET